MFGFRRKLHFSSFNVSPDCCRHENPNTSRARLMWVLVSCRVFNLLPGLETGCLILLSADSRVVSSGGPAGATSHLRQSRIINPSPVLNLGLFDDDWATFGFKFRFFFFFNVLASSTTSFISFIAFYSFFLQQFVRLIEILFEFLLEPKEVSLHTRARAHTYARTHAHAILMLMELWMNH